VAGIFVTVDARNDITGGGAPGPFSYTFAGLTVSAAGQKDTQFVGLTAGDYELSGQMMTEVLHLGFNPSAGFAPRSMQVLEGPTPTPGCRGVSFRGPVGATGQNIRIKVTVASGTPASPCLN
jgi:hypothetical protein